MTLTSSTTNWTIAVDLNRKCNLQISKSRKNVADDDIVGGCHWTYYEELKLEALYIYQTLKLPSDAACQAMCLANPAACNALTYDYDYDE